LIAKKTIRRKKLQRNDSEKKIANPLSLLLLNHFAIGSCGTFFCRHSSYRLSKSGLPDFSWSKIPKRGKYTKLLENVPNEKKTRVRIPPGEKVFREIIAMLLCLLT
jgi:hypothetical protein